MEISESQSRWLGGVFEAGGTCYFETSFSKFKGVRYPYSCPVLHAGDNNYEKMKSFKQRLGGGFGSRSLSKSYNWSTKGRLAVTLAEAMKPFAPYRQEAIAAFELWNEELDKEQRLEVAKSFREKPKPEYPEKSAYTGLVKIPEFVAGILDIRGSSYVRFSNRPEQNIDYAWPELRIQTPNRPLLEALQEVYGGAICLGAPVGTIKVSRGRESMVLRDVLYLAIGANDTRNLLPSVEPHLIIGKINGRNSE